MELPQFQPHRPSEQDIERAKNLGPTDCPRRYCRFWQSPEFDWDVPVSGGCRFAHARDFVYVKKWFPQREHPCCRLDPSSTADQYDVVLPRLAEDGMPFNSALRVHHEPDLYRYPGPAVPGRPSLEEIERAAQLAETDCPRRYCWWWRWLSFQWDIPLEQGCDRHESERGETPCCRRDSKSTVDHYEPREPHLMEDGFGVDRFDRPAREGGEE